MLCVKRDTAGRIEAAAEVRLVDDVGTLDPEGRWAWVEQVEVNPGLEAREVFRYIMAYFARWMPTAMWCYWVRKDKTGLKTIHGPYSRQRIEQNMGKGAMCDATLASS